MVAQIDSGYLWTRPFKAFSRLVSWSALEGRPLTARGRWINPLVLFQFALLKQLPQLKHVKAPIYILGTGRNGSTLLGKVLSLHQDVCFLNEPKALWYSILSETDVIGSYSASYGKFRLSVDDASLEVSNSLR